MKFGIILTVVAAQLLFCGCEVVRLANGKYESTLQDRDDFAAVYGDLIIIRLRNPENEEGTDDGYWDWGGKYKIAEDKSVVLDMDRETARVWEFYYDLKMLNNAIKVTDHRAEMSYRLEYIPAIPYHRMNQHNNAGSVPPEVYPAYQ